MKEYWHDSLIYTSLQQRGTKAQVINTVLKCKNCYIDFLTNNTQRNCMQHDTI